MLDLWGRFAGLCVCVWVWAGFRVQLRVGKRVNSLRDMMEVEGVGRKSTSVVLDD